MARFINADEAVLKAIKDYPAVEMECNGDLISRSALLKQLLEAKDNGIIKAVIGLVESQPTAYDKEKVIAELEEMTTLCSAGTIINGAYIGRNKAIDIVKRGGVE